MANLSEHQPSCSRQIPLCVPEIRGNEWKYVKECLDTNWVSSAGNFVNEFERVVGNFVGREFGVATSSGTSAIHVGLQICGVRPEDEVLVPTLTFIAPVNAIRYLGAWPVFIDAEPGYWQMDVDKASEFLNKKCEVKNGELFNKATKRRVKAILPVHILGHPCDVSPLIEIADKYNLQLVEDATESLGATYNGEMVGTFGSVACLSFNGNKLITTGGGGMIVTDDSRLAAKAQYLTTQAKDDPVEYFHSEIGYNYRLNNIQAALGVAQMEQIGDFIKAKKRIAEKYSKNLNKLPGITLMDAQPGTDPVYWLYTVLLPVATSLPVRKKFIQNLSSYDIQARPLWHPVHGLPPYLQCQADRIDIAPNLYHRGVSIPCSVGLTEDDQDKCISAFNECYEQL